MIIQKTKIKPTDHISIKWLPEMFCLKFDLQFSFTVTGKPCLFSQHWRYFPEMQNLTVPFLIQRQIFQDRFQTQGEGYS